MTTPLRRGPCNPRSPTSGRLRLAVSASAALASIALASIAGPLVGTAQAQTSGTETGLVLVSQAAWTHAEQPLSLRVRVTGTRPEEELSIGLRVHAAVTTRNQFNRTLAGTGLGATVGVMPETPLPHLARDADGARTLALGQGLANGVYPVVATLRDRGSGAVLDSFVTYLVRVPERVDVPLQVAWVQPVGAAPATRPDGAIDLDVAKLDQVRQAIGALAANPQLPLTIDLTPETAAAVAARRPDLAAELGRIAANRRLLAAPYVDVDVSRLVALGRGVDVETQRSNGEQVLTLLTGSTGDPRIWSSEASLSPAAVGRLLTMGVTTVVVPETDLFPLDLRVSGPTTLARPFALEDEEGRLVDAVMADTGLQAHFANAADHPALAAQHLLADLAVLYQDAPGTRHGVVVRPPPGWPTLRAMLDPAFSALSEGVVVSAVTVDSLVGNVPALESEGRPVVRSLVPGAGEVNDGNGETDGGDGPGAADRLDEQVAAAIGATWTDLRGIRSMAIPTDTLVRLERQLLVAEADGLSTDERRNRVAAVTLAVSGVRGGVRVLQGRTFRLTAREGTIPLTLVNENPFPVTVTLELSSDKLDFVDAPGPDGPSLSLPNLVLAPGQRRVLKVPVRARASAAFPVRAVLRSPSGEIELSRVQFTIVSTAVSGVGIILSAGAALVLAWWWIRHGRQARAARRAAALGEHPAGLHDQRPQRR